MNYPNGMNVYPMAANGPYGDNQVLPNQMGASGLPLGYGGQVPSYQTAGNVPLAAAAYNYSRQAANPNDGKRFPVSTTYGGQFEFKSNSFHVVGSKGGTPVILPIAGMKKLLEHLPVLQEQIRRLQFELNGRIDLESIHHSAGILPTTTLPPVKDDRIVINTSTPKASTAPGNPPSLSYRATLQISTYNQNAKLWLKCFFDAPDKFNPGKMVYGLCCKGGAILNDTDAVGLARFFTECTGIEFP